MTVIQKTIDPDRQTKYQTAPLSTKQNLTVMHKAIGPDRHTEKKLERLALQLTDLTAMQKAIGPDRQTHTQICRHAIIQYCDHTSQIPSFSA
jgi:hypothetical protein